MNIANSGGGLQVHLLAYAVRIYQGSVYMLILIFLNILRDSLRN
jgi:hypothetical protein